MRKMVKKTPFSPDRDSLQWLETLNSGYTLVENAGPYVKFMPQTTSIQKSWIQDWPFVLNTPLILDRRKRREGFSFNFELPGFLSSLKLTTETVLGTYEIVITGRETVWILWKNTFLHYILSNLHIKLRCNILISNITCLIWSKEKKLIVLENDIWACDYHFYIVKLHYSSNFRPPASWVNILLARP